MSVHFRGLVIGMAGELLDASQGHASDRQMGAERVPESVQRATYLCRLGVLLEPIRQRIGVDRHELVGQ